MAIVLVFLPSFRHQGQNDFNPMLVETLGQLKASSICNPYKLTMTCVMPSHIVGISVHGIALTTAQGSSSSLGPLPPIHMGGFLSA